MQIWSQTETHLQRELIVNHLDSVSDPVSRSIAVNKSDTNMLSDCFITSNKFWLSVSRFFSRNPYTLYDTCRHTALCML